MKQIIKVGGAPLQVGGGSNVGYGLGEPIIIGITSQEGVICCSNGVIGG